MRVHWENRVPIPRLYPPVPNIKASPDTEGVIDDTFDDVGTRGVWLEPLWDDVMAQYKPTETPFELPDLHQNLPHQKLQMINMCIACGDVPTTVDPEEVTTCVSRARKGLVTRLDHLNAHIQAEKENKEDEEVEGGDDEASGVTHKESLMSFINMKVSSRDLSHITPPRLQRRLPMTSDALAQHKHLANKLRQGSSRSASESTMLKWQILYPELISDVRAFKACNRTVLSSHSSSPGGDSCSHSDRPVTFEDFVVWYGGAGVSLPRHHTRAGANTGATREDVVFNERGQDGITLDNLMVGRHITYHLCMLMLIHIYVVIFVM